LLPWLTQGAPGDKEVKKNIILTAFVLTVSILVFSGCYYDPVNVNPAQATKYSLDTLNANLRGPAVNLPKGPVTLTGYVVSQYQGVRYPMVLGLSQSAGHPKNKAPEIVWCLFEELPPGPYLSRGTLITVAGLLDRSSASDHIVLTAATLVQVIKP
jgi:hypothetical protein